jgi:decaprenylphospho-beta-D-erythro-pentofuranosid-2-ulose 2-reductase
VLGRALAEHYAATGYRIVVAGRDEDELQRVAKDVAIRKGAVVDALVVDLADSRSIDAAILTVLQGKIPQISIFVAGASTGSREAPYRPDLAANLLAINYAGITRFVGGMLPRLEASPDAMLAFVSSVAGDRGRRTNFVYAAAKAALNTYCEGLRALLVPYKVGVLTIKLGYMDSRLAYGVAPPIFTCSPIFAARAIAKAIGLRRCVVYVPGFWRWICLVLRMIPERIFIRLPIP